MKTDIKALTTELREKYDPEGASFFPFEDIERDHDDLTITFKPLKDDIFGLILFDEKNDGFLIAINSTKSKRKQYFTLAHEIGHYFLHKEEIKKQEKKVIVDKEIEIYGRKMLFFSDSNSNSELEMEANTFVLELLLPEEAVRTIWEILPIIEKSAEVFHVSPSLLSLRLEQFGLIES